mmetsp:Transcript_15019/g.34216  ORF Transcript_15019/g.34216 Transcript_15019/m.34216 type:complete len:92 (+) Transcript_15019:35-310(+)
MERSLVRLAKMGIGKGRGPLNTKRAPDLKKGYGSIGLGRHTKKGFFHINPMLFPMIKVPDLNSFELLPYVSRRTPVISNAHPYWKTGKFKP